ncbi:MAG: hypothetical protein ACI8W8_003560 [Rhodothermales bacterium]|jgi:hypothetical protein
MYRLFLALVTVLPLLAANIDRQLATIKAVGAEGSGNAAAAAAWQQISSSNSEQVVPILVAIKGASPVAANYLRAAAETIVSRELKAGKNLGLAPLLAYLADTKNDPRARRLAFELIRQIDPDKASPLISGFADDPSLELRADAVAQIISLAQEQEGANGVAEWQTALNHARDLKQIEVITKALEDAGQKVDLQTHFGFLPNWQIIGPFDNSERKGFAVAYAPEAKVDLKATYKGKDETVRWQRLSSDDPYGMVDINPALGALKGSIAYATTTITAKAARDAQLRLGCKNAWKVWVNGTLIFARDEYHRGMRMDQYHLSVSLRKGANTVLIKLCQDEQTQPWTKEWQFQMRLCDELGAAIAP